MRLNKFIAAATGISRRAADTAIGAGRVTVNGVRPTTGAQAGDADTVALDGSVITLPVNTRTIMLNKPAGFVCSREGQGSRTVYDLLPPELHQLKPVGRLDKNSSGLLLMTTDGELAHKLTHPSFQKLKVYEVLLDKPLAAQHRQMISNQGVTLDDGVSRFDLEPMADTSASKWRVRMHEGRNRQIRRTFAALGYTVTRLHRTHFGTYALGKQGVGTYKQV